jgi:hypothetical protein
MVAVLARNGMGNVRERLLSVNNLRLMIIEFGRTSEVNRYVPDRGPIGENCR